MRQQFAWYLSIALCNCTRELNDLLRIDKRFVRTTVALLQSFGVGLSHTKAMHQIAGYVVAAEVERAKMADLAIQENCDVGGASTHLNQGNTKLLLVFCQHAERTSQWLQHQLAYMIARPLDALAQVHCGRATDGYQIHFSFETSAYHPDRIADAGVLVYRVFLRDGMQQFAVLRNRLCPRHFVGTIYVCLGDLVAIHSHDSLAGHRTNMLARYTGV